MNSTLRHGVATHYTPRRLVRTSGPARHLLQPVCVYSPATKYATFWKKKSYLEQMSLAQAHKKL